MNKFVHIAGKGSFQLDRDVGMAQGYFPMSNHLRHALFDLSWIPSPIISQYRTANLDSREIQLPAGQRVALSFFPWCLSLSLFFVRDVGAPPVTQWIVQILACSRLQQARRTSQMEARITTSKTATDLMVSEMEPP